MTGSVHQERLFFEDSCRILLPLSGDFYGLLDPFFIFQM